MRIDAHQHYWRIGANGHQWPTPDLPAIYRDFLPADLDPIRADRGIDATVVVQSQPSDADTDWLLSVAADTPSIGAVVGWADLRAPDAPARIANLSGRAKLRGLRPMLQSLPDDWILDPALAPAIAAMAAHGLVFDALIRECQIGPFVRFAAAHPDLTIVIDHGAKPDMVNGRRADWVAGMAALAALPNVRCKLSGLVTEAVEDWREEDVIPYMLDLLRLFGPDRLLWGSDWPVVLLRCDYAAWFDLASLVLASLSGPERAAIFGGNAARLYRIHDRA